MKAQKQEIYPQMFYTIERSLFLKFDLKLKDNVMKNI